MGLLDLLLQNKSILDIEVPSVNGGPINVPSNNFVQHYLPNHSYLSSIQGAPDNGSALSSTLNNTNLDTTDAASTTNIAAPSPDLITQYPQYSHGEFGGASTLYSQVWSETNPYISQFDPNTQPNTLSETGLDNDNPSYTSTTSLPYNVTEYPSLSSGEFGGASSQYVPLYGPNNTYLNTFDANAQTNTLDETGLDVENPGFNSTTTVPNNISAPTNYGNTPFQAQMGEFGGAASQYATLYDPNNTYGNTIPIIVDPSNNPQVNSLSETGFDIEDPSLAPTTFTPNNISAPTDYSNTPPQAYMGEWNQSPTQYTQIFGPSQTYGNTISTIVNPSNNAQANSLNLTGLDIGDSTSAPTSFIPNNISVPTDYGNTPSQAQMGEFGGAASQYVTPYGPDNTYLDTFNSDTQVNTLGETGLDIENVNFAPTTFAPNSTSAPTDYSNTPPQAQLGEFGGAPSQYNSVYSPSNTYGNALPDIININSNLQVAALDETGLDIENSNSAPTAFTPNNISIPTDYSNTPPQAQMGEFGNAASQYSTPYNPNNTYLNTLNTDTQVNTLGETGLDINNPEFNSTTIPPNNISAPTNYGNIPPQAQMGKFSGAPSQYVTAYTPDDVTYGGSLPNIININSNPQVNTLGETGLDIEDPNFAPTTFPLNNITAPTDYSNTPPQAYMGEFNGAPSQYVTSYTPNTTYGDSLPSVINVNSNPQVNTLESTGLNIGDNLSAPTSFIPGDPTVYPYINSVNLGEFNGPPSFFAQPYTSNKYYLFPSNLSKLIDPDTNPQIKTLNGEIQAFTLTSTPETSLDVRVTTDNVTIYPSSYVTGVTGSAPHLFNQRWSPDAYANTYYGYMKENGFAAAVA